MVFGVIIGVLSKHLKEISLFDQNMSNFSFVRFLPIFDTFSKFFQICLTQISQHVHVTENFLKTGLWYYYIIGIFLCDKLSEVNIQHSQDI